MEVLSFPARLACLNLLIGLKEIAMEKLGRPELERLVEKIRKESGCIVDLDALISRFEANVQNPSASRWIFESPTGRLLSAREVVDRAMEDRA